MSLLTSRRQLALLALLAAVGVVVLSYLYAGERFAQIGRATHDNGTQGSAPREDQAPHQERDSRVTPAPGTSPSAPTALSSTSALRGTVVVLDTAGREHTTEDGDLVLIAWKDDSGTVVAAKVTAGRFEVSLPRCEELSVNRLRLGGRPAVVGPGRTAPPPSGVLALQARWPAPTTLKVVDGHVGRELNRVVVFKATRSDGVGLMHPGADATDSPVVGDAPSPIVLPDRVGRANYWVRSPGYAWRRVHIDHSVGGTHVVRLKAGGAIEIQLTNYRADSRARVRVRRNAASENSDSEPGRPDAEATPSVAGPVVIDALEPGDYRVSIEMGSWLRRVVALGSANTKVEPGTTTVVVIRLDDPPPVPQRVPLSGILELPPEWGILEPELHLNAFDDDGELGVLEDPRGPLACRSVKGELRWDAGKVLPGRYVLTIDDPPFSTMLVVDARGTRDARVVVPRPSNVVVRTIEAGTRGSVRVDEILLERLSFPVPTGGTRGSVTTIEPDKTGVARARVPAGRFRVSIESSEYVLSVSDHAAGSWEVRPGKDEIVVMVTRPSGIRVDFPDLTGEGFEITRFKIEIRPLGRGRGAARLWRYGPSSQTFVVTTAGSYEVRVRPPGRFNSVAPQVVKVRAAHISELTVDLELRE